MVQNDFSVSTIARALLRYRKKPERLSLWKNQMYSFQISPVIYESRLQTLSQLMSLVQGDPDITEFCQSQRPIRNTADLGLIGIAEREKEYEEKLQHPVNKRVLPKRGRNETIHPTEPIVISDDEDNDEDYSSESLNGSEEEDSALPLHAVGEEEAVAGATDNPIPLKSQEDSSQPIPIKWNHEQYSTDGTEIRLLNQIRRSLESTTNDYVQAEFATYLSDILPMEIQQSCSELCSLAKQDLSLEYFRSDLNIVTKGANKTVLPDMKLLYYHIIQLLTLSICSESECERMFSKCREYYGERRQRAGALTVNHSFVVRYGEYPAKSISES